MGEVRISVPGGLPAGRQEKIATRTEALSERWDDYRMSFYDGTTPLFWRLPRN